jgi:hypothetical protein
LNFTVYSGCFVDDTVWIKLLQSLTECRALGTLIGLPFSWATDFFPGNRATIDLSSRQIESKEVVFLVSLLKRATDSLVSLDLR